MTLSPRQKVQPTRSMRIYRFCRAVRPDQATVPSCLSAGGSWIRTIGPSRHDQDFKTRLVRDSGEWRYGGANETRGHADAGPSAGLMVRIPFPPARGLSLRWIPAL